MVEEPGITGVGVSESEHILIIALVVDEVIFVADEMTGQATVQEW